MKGELLYKPIITNYNQSNNPIPCNSGHDTYFLSSPRYTPSELWLNENGANKKIVSPVEIAGYYTEKLSYKAPLNCRYYVLQFLGKYKDSRYGLEYHPEMFAIKPRDFHLWRISADGNSRRRITVPFAKLAELYQRANSSGN
jgi:hypothetical protein